MLQLVGEYCKDCKIFTDNIEDEAMKLINDIINCKAFENQKIRIMPDVHAGKGIVIGFTSTFDNYICPSHVGVDIGCTISGAILDKKIPQDKIPDFEHKIRQAIKFGFDIHSKTMFDEKEFYKFLSSEFKKAKSKCDLIYELPDTVTEKWVSDQLKRLNMDEGTFYKSIGTVGSGNHYIELDEDSNNQMLTVHCGSRNFGVKVCSYWEKIASNYNKFIDKKSIVNKAKEICKNDKKKIKETITKLTEDATKGYINGYLSGDNMRGYLADMVFAQAYAKWNHKIIHKIIESIYNKYECKCKDFISTTHNYIDFNDLIIRKGAVRSVYGEKLLVPFNMRDGVAVCEGMSNQDWNCSCSHGAGRKMSRNKAKSTLDMNEFKKEMTGIYSTTVCESTIDESPMAYKDTNEIKNLIENNTVHILSIMKPIMNIKAV